MKWLKPKLKVIFELIILGLIIAMALTWIFPSQPEVSRKMITPVFYQKIDEQTIQCQLCSLNCLLQEEERGECGEIINKSGELFYVR